MKTTPTTRRLVAFVASALVTLGSLQLIADYALPVATTGTTVVAAR